MTHQPTSIQAYRWIAESTILQRLHREICRTLLTQLMPMTAGEIAAGMTPPGRINSISPRMRELRRMGVVREAKTRPCRITGRMAIAWELSGEEPTAPEYVKPERCPTCLRTI